MTLIKPGTQRMLNKCHHACLMGNLKPPWLPEPFPLVIDPDIDPQPINIKKQICPKGRC